MKSLFRRLFAGGRAAEPVPAAAEEYRGFRIRPTPFRAEGQYQTAGIIERTVDGIAKEHRFIRAERHSSAEEAAAFALTKGRQIIDEQGERVFEQR
jgi:hypothetical protein